MSIPNLFHKIKSKMNIDKEALLYLFIIIIVGISSFGLGLLFANFTPNKDKNVAIAKTEDILNNQAKIEGESREKAYVASKNGKMYYKIGCAGAKRINPENEVWFSTKEDAEKSGFVLSTTCK